MDRKWLPLLGDFISEENTIVFIGNSIETVNPSTNEKIKRPSIGNLLYNDVFREGRIVAEVEFKNANIDSVCEIIYNYKDENNIIKMSNVGLSGYLFMVSSRQFDGKEWKPGVLKGEGKNLKSNKKYILELNVRGSTLDFKVDGIDMFSTTIPSILSKSQVGIWCQDFNDIIIHDFQVYSLKPKVFVIMQLSDEYNQLYNEVIYPVCKSFGYETIKADECYTTGLIIEDIIRQIKESSIVIADITPNNPNVFYEVGYSHAINKPTILLSDKKRDRLPFDVSSFRTLFYDNTIAGKTVVENKLKQFLENISHGAY